MLTDGQTDRLTQLRNLGAQKVSENLFGNLAEKLPFFKSREFKPD